MYSYNVILSKYIRSLKKMMIEKSDKKKSEALCKHNQCVMLTSDGFSGIKEEGFFLLRLSDHSSILFSPLSFFLATNMKWVKSPMRKSDCIKFRRRCRFWMIFLDIKQVNLSLRKGEEEENPLAKEKRTLLSLSWCGLGNQGLANIAYTWIISFFSQSHALFTDREWKITEIFYSFIENLHPLHTHSYFLFIFANIVIFSLQCDDDDENQNKRLKRGKGSFYRIL
jgi:hypothetical protein